MRSVWSCLAVLALAVGCTGPKVAFDYDSRANYSGYQTYDWYAPTGAAKARAGGVQNPLMDARVRRSVEAQLGAKSFRRETVQDPDFLVTYYPVYQRRRGSRVHLGVGMGLGPFVGVGVSAPVGAGPSGAVGSIVLEVQDFKTKLLVWRAVAEDVLDDTEGPEGSDQDVAAAVQKMLDRFPPRKP